MIAMGLIKKSGNHGYSGSCAPGGTNWLHYKNFSVGIFEWIPKFPYCGRAEDLKKSVVKIRVHGNTLNEQAVYDMTEAICRQLDAGTYSGLKNVRVK
jgi:hypothetical protein